jgi:DNA-binding protein HU-beta
MEIGKTELIARVSEKAGITKADTARVINAAFEEAADALKNGDSLVIRDFGTLKVQAVSERKGRNPQTGEEITIEAHNKVKFNAGKALADAVK